MEASLINNNILNQTVTSTDKPFITANTVAISLDEIRHKHIIPVFVKDNEPVISQADFIDTAIDVAQYVFQRETILSPSIRISHPIKGRIPEAKNKPAEQLTEEEKTIYFERMAFVIEIPSITDCIGGNQLSLTIGGVKAYNLDNLYNKKGSEEHFKIFIGFQNKVCTNLCVWSDGCVADLRVKSSNELVDAFFNLVSTYNTERQLKRLHDLTHCCLTENQFAQLIGRCKMYQYLIPSMKKEIPELQFGENQISMVVKDYYHDKSFCKLEDGSIDVWRLYNLFTGANKTSYIDTFLDRGVNAFDFVNSINNALEKGNNNWFLN